MRKRKPEQPHKGWKDAARTTHYRVRKSKGRASVKNLTTGTVRIMPDQEESKKKIKVHVWKRDLPSGAKVEVGFDAAREDDSYYLYFTNPEGDLTKMRLSREALDAVIALKSELDSHRDVGTVYRWKALVDVKDGEVTVSADNG